MIPETSPDNPTAWDPGDELRRRLDEAGDDPSEVVDLLQADQASRWRSGRRTPAERYVSLLPDPDRCLDEATDLAYGEFLLRRELGEGPALAEYLVRFPTLADRLRALAELDDALDGEPSMPPDAPAVRPGGAAPQGAQRFRVLRPHARGGLGAVFVALDGELNREVALKRILDHHADDPSSRRRFVLEAEITGGLEHPGIVPVYGLGAQGDGRPYYAMRFVRGDTLTRAIDRFHSDAAAPADPGRRSLALRELLRRFLDVCNAIDYAHSRGVLHRDIKPSNVIVGKHGETLVVDWGLAKARGKEDLLDPDAERPLVPSSASGSAETLPGRALGTPAYMSPEQARGDLDRLGPRSDVYSLGATLYCLLTGRPPFQSDDLASVLQAVQEGDFPPPRRANPRVDRPLEAVCLRAMALLPEGRYESARDLAREVERWLADEPVSAYREPIPARVGRWARRHRTSVAVAVALLLAAVVALAVGAVLLASANTRIEAGAQQARENAEVARINAAEAEENFKLARDAVDRYLVGVEENDLLREPYMAGLRAELLGSAREFYEAFLRRRRDDPSIERDLADANSQLGRIDMSLGKVEEAIEAFREADERFTRVLADRPDDFDAFRERSYALRLMADSLRSLGRIDEAGVVLRRCLEQAEARPTDDADGLEVRLIRVYALIALGTNAHDGGRADEASDFYDRAGALLDDVSEENRAQVGYLDRVRSLQSARGRLAFDRGLMEESSAAHQVAVGVSEALASDPDEVGRRPRVDLSISLVNLSAPLTRLGRFPEAIEAAERAVSILREVTGENPEYASDRSRLGKALINLEQARRRAGRTEEADRDLAEALEVYDRLTRDFPGQFEYALSLSAALGNRGNSRLADRKFAESVGDFERSLSALEPVLRSNPGNLGARQIARNNAWGLADALGGLGRHRDAISAFDRAMPFADGRPRDELRMERAATLARAGEAQAAADEARAGLALADPFHRLLAARALAIASASALDVDSGRSEAFAREATEALGRLEAEGWFSQPDRRARLRSADFEPLSRRPEFQALLLDVAFPDDPFTTEAGP